MRQIHGKKAKSDRKENMTEKDAHCRKMDCFRELYIIFVHMEEDYDRLLKDMCVYVRRVEP